MKSLSFQISSSEKMVNQIKMKKKKKDIEENGEWNSTKANQAP